MIRVGSQPIETEFGTFYAGIHQVNEEYGPSFYAETATGMVAINGIVYQGSVYFEKSQADAEYSMSAQHMQIWREGKGFVNMSDSAHRKLKAALLPGIKKMSEDQASILARRIATAKSDFEFAVTDAERALATANELAERVRALGEYCVSVKLVRIHPASGAVVPSAD